MRGGTNVFVRIGFFVEIWALTMGKTWCIILSKEGEI